MRKRIYWSSVVAIGMFIVFMFFTPWLNAGPENKEIVTFKQIGEQVTKWMEAGDVPGLVLVLVRGDEPAFIKGYGYADLAAKTPVSGETLFELASCSKSFTGLAALKLQEQGLIDLDAPVSRYLSWFSALYRNEPQQITLKQCLHHTSGIPWETISGIQPDNSPEALENTVRKLSGVDLFAEPGKVFKYATINYDIIGAVIQQATGKSFEAYIQDEIFNPLGLTHTRVGASEKEPLMATGYKQGFFKPREYHPPVYRGNNPAGYIISNGQDMAKWLRVQMGVVENELALLVRQSHIPDLTVPPAPNYSSYALGWRVDPYRDNETFHTGLNPNFTSYVGFRPNDRVGVVVLANSNSSFTQFIGRSALRMLSGQEPLDRYPGQDKVDAFCSILAIFLVFYILVALVFILLRIIGAFRGKNRFAPLTWKKVVRLLSAILGILPFLWGFYIIPRAVAHMSWEAIRVWSPISFQVAFFLLMLSLGVGYIQYALSLLLPTRRRYRNEIPQIAIISILSGLAGTALLFLITTSFFSTIDLGYLLFYFGLAYLLNVGGRKIAQTKMINLSNNIALDLRIDLIHKLFSTKYQHFEKIEDGRIFTTLNEDTGILAATAGLLIGIVTNLVTVLSGFIYMTTISVLSTLVVIGVTIGLVFYYRLVARQGRVYLEAARDSQNVYMSLLNGTIRGYKELSIHRRKKYEFKEDLIESSRINFHKSILAAIKFLNANLIGDSFAIIVLGVLSIVISRVLTGVNIITLISFVMVILYLLGPLRVILNGLPTLTRLRVSWDRIKFFVRDLEVKGGQESVKEFIRNLDLPKTKETISREDFANLYEPVETLKVQGLMFEYERQEEEKGFVTGPVDFIMKKGEILFIIGGNGSGKTTAAKLITGLYLQDEGSIVINGREVTTDQLGEYFSTIYSNYHLFKKLYGVDVDEKGDLIPSYLEMLDLKDKVQVEGNEYSTLDLSGGQRKRLALFQCLMEDRPIFLFDELAADQDPEFRRFFYRQLLPQMKKAGKLVIAITHDDHYFDVADRVVKMDMGKIDMVSSGKDFGSKLSLTGATPKE